MKKFALLFLGSLLAVSLGKQITPQKDDNLDKKYNELIEELEDILQDIQNPENVADDVEELEKLTEKMQKMGVLDNDDLLKELKNLKL